MYKLSATPLLESPLRSSTSSERRTASVAGWLMAATFVTAIAGLILYGPILSEGSFILDPHSETRITLGAFLEILLMVANIGVAVVMFPILRRHSEAMALGYVGSRIVESVVIGVGVISLLSILTLGEDFGASSGADDASLNAVGQALVAVHDWTFLFGPGFCVGVNGLLLGWLMYRTGLMPRRLALLGVVGGPLIFVSSIAVLFGVYPQDGAHFLFALPEIGFELSFAIYLIVKGFRPSPVLSGEPVA
jgi:hypothetical protein